MTGGLLVVCPVILPPRPDVLASWDHRPHLCIVNGHADEWEAACAEHGLTSFVTRDAQTGEVSNAGCPKSWNWGFEIARDYGFGYVAIVSQSLVLRSGTSKLAQWVDRRADERGLTTDWSFHCIVFSVALWERMGGFDEGLPIWCDIDFLWRCHEAGERTPERPMPGVRLVGRSERAAAAMAGAVPVSFYLEDEQQFIAKWGADARRDPCSNDPAPGPRLHGSDRHAPL